jgi:rare lipoprotein A
MQRWFVVAVSTVLFSLMLASPAFAYGGYASWYDAPGQLTASGDYYESYDYTCASWYYDFGTYLTVSRGGSSITCVVTDRGGYYDLDLSYQAAADLGLIYRGVGAVDIYISGYDYYWYYGKQY